MPAPQPLITTQPEITTQSGVTRRIVTFLFGARVAKVYLFVVAASLALAMATLAFGHTGEGPNLAWLYPIMVTLPWSLLMICIPVPSDGPAGVIGMTGIVLLSTLANLATLGALRHVIGRTPAAQPQGVRTH